MSSTSQKHQDFVGEPMGEKGIETVAGIGKVLGKKLSDKGYDKAYVLLGQFLLLKKSDELFLDWFKDTCGANKKQANDAYQCLKDWCDANL
uniref:Barrier-to-autointegration factor-like protein n=1 Tax=Ciona intestinalis TaxID=7719 RepID=H2XUT9_CIOIN|nr:barrier-to-autointegration factor [Ciona intestinalis]|eukprot:XP_018669723.1 barrier-to-autointegration factor [Ciona intestinalis]